MATVSQRDRAALSELYKHIDLNVEQEDFTAKRFAALADIPYGQAQRLLSEWEAVGIVDRNVTFTPRVGKVSKVTFTLPLDEAIAKWQGTSHVQPEKIEGSGEKERILRVLADAGGKPLTLDDFDLHIMAMDKHNLVHQLWSLQKERLVKFREGRGNGTGRRGHGLEDIQLTQMGWERLGEYARKDESLTLIEIEEPVPSLKFHTPEGADESESPANDYVGEDKPEIEAQPLMAVAPVEDYPILAELRQREQKVATASKLLEEASVLLAQVSINPLSDRATELAIEALGLKVLSAVEVEYLRYASETTVTDIGAP